MSHPGKIMKNNYNDCINNGLLRKVVVSAEEIQNQIKIAENYIKKAELVFGKDTYDISFLTAYLTAYISVFHSARALLYYKGFKERSHYCLFEFVRDAFEGDQVLARLAEVAQSYREIRHLVQYEGSVCSDATAKEAIRDAKALLAAAKNYVKTKS